MTPKPDQADVERTIRAQGLEALARKFTKLAQRAAAGKLGAHAADTVRDAIELYRGLNVNAGVGTLDRMTHLSKLLSGEFKPAKAAGLLSELAEQLTAIATGGVDTGLVGDLTHLPVAEICPGDNDRTVFDDEGLKKLADSIRDDGLVQPISVRFLVPARDGFKFQIVAGERRFRAVRDILKQDTIAAIVREMTDEQAAAWMLAENVHRADIDPIDEANAYHKRMEHFGWTINQVAEKANVNAKRVAARLGLRDLLPDMQMLIRKQQIPIAFGELMSPLDPNRQQIALKYVAESKHPFLREFKVLCGKLLAEQAQDVMFDLAALDANAIIRDAKAEGVSERVADYDRKAKFPMDLTLPTLYHVGSIGESLHTYLLVLNASPDPQHRSAAQTVGYVYDSLVRLGLCFPPHRHKLGGLAENARRQVAQLQANASSD